MKKLTFALACASTLALFAEDAAPAKAPLANFESIKADTLLSAAPAEANGPFWAFAEGDSSKVKAYEKASDTTGANYLELSTEGNTLWRSINAVQTAGQPGPAETIPETGLYIDTMVQFTPTEDGGEPETTGDDKLAIWLNVTTDEQTKASVTNLMVKSSFYYAQDAQTVLHSNRCYKLSGTYEAGAWYRLTVKAVKSLTGAFGQEAGIFLPGFEISVDGQVLTTDEQVCDAGALTYLITDEVEGEMVTPYLDAAAAAKLTGKTFIPSIAGYQSEDVSALQAVGFKGSGALDNLQFTTEKPGVDPAGGEFEVNWGSEGVQKVWGSTTPTDDELAAIQAWAVKNGLSATDVAGETGAAAYLLGLTAVPETVPELKITAITQTETGWTITIACKEQPDLSKINGSLVVKTAAELGGDWTSTVVTTPAATVTVTADGAKFMKAAIGKPVPPAGE